MQISFDIWHKILAYCVIVPAQVCKSFNEYLHGSASSCCILQKYIINITRLHKTGTIDDIYKAINVNSLWDIVRTVTPYNTRNLPNVFIVLYNVGVYQHLSVDKFAKIELICDNYNKMSQIPYPLSKPLADANARVMYNMLLSINIAITCKSVSDYDDLRIRLLIEIIPSLFLGCVFQANPVCLPSAKLRHIIHVCDSMNVDITHYTGYSTEFTNALVALIHNNITDDHIIELADNESAIILLWIIVFKLTPPSRFIVQRAIHHELFIYYKDIVVAWLLSHNYVEYTGLFDN